MSRTHGLRHVFTAAGSGFTSLVYSEQLQDLVPEIERLVEGFSAPEGSEPTCRQLLKVPETPAYALTTFTATGAMPDGRPGNYWAETVVVPEAWLEASGWDTAAAFESLEWLGPRDSLDKPKPAVLPALEPGPLSRLAVLRETVPPDQLKPLLRAVVQQVRGLRPLRVLGAAETSSEALDRVVMLLPLLVHPSFRTYRENGKRRCLTFRTMNPAAAMAPATDLTGMPSAAADWLAMEGSDVVDFAGRIAPPPSRDRAGENYVHWLADGILNQLWDDLEEEFRKPLEGRAEAWLATFQKPRPSLPARPSEAGWEALKLRDQAEGEAWKIAGDLQQRFQASLDEFQRSIEKAAAEAEHGLKAVVEDRVADLGRQARDVTTTATARHHRLESVFSQRIDALESRIEELGRQVEALSHQQSSAVDPLVTSGRTEGPTPRRYQAKESRYDKWMASIRERLIGVRWFRSGRSRTVFAGLAGASILFAAYFLIDRYLERRSESGSADTAVVSAPAAPPVSREERRSNLVKGFQDGAVAAALIARAKAAEAYAARADRLAMMVTLGKIRFTTAGEIALLQQALGATTDGAWGKGSRDLLKSRLEVCGQCLPPEERAEPGNIFLEWDKTVAHCFLRTHLQLSTEACREESPWLAGRSWTEGEAGRALDLIRATAAVVNPELKRHLLTFDGAESAGVREIIDQLPSLSEAHAAIFLDLAHSWLTKKPDGRLPETPTDRQLEDLETFLADLNGGGG